MIKQTLHHIYKHYDALQKKGPQSAQQGLEETLARAREQVAQLRVKTEQAEMANNLDQQKLEMAASDPGTLKGGAELVQGVGQEELLLKLETLKRNNAQLAAETERLRQKEDQRLYEVKYRQEMRARKSMERRALEIAFENIDVRSHRQMALAQEVRGLQEILETKKRQRDFLPARALQKEKKALQERLRNCDSQQVL